MDPTCQWVSTIICTDYLYNRYQIEFKEHVDFLQYIYIINNFDLSITDISIINEKTSIKPMMSLLKQDDECCQVRYTSDMYILKTVNTGILAYKTNREISHIVKTNLLGDMVSDSKHV